MRRLLFVRHGETVWNTEGRLQGQEDVPLSARGIEQARALAPIVQAFSPVTVVASDLQRTRQTAEALGYPEYQLDSRLREAHLGSWVGLSASELLLSDADAYLAWRDGILTPPNGESFSLLVERVREGLEPLTREPGPLLIVTHGGVVRAALALLLGISPDRVVAVSPASLTIIDLPADTTHGSEPVGLSSGARLHSLNITGYSALGPAPD